MAILSWLGLLPWWDARRNSDHRYNFDPDWVEYKSAMCCCLAEGIATEIGIEPRI
jgi:hypothetical protein